MIKYLEISHNQAGPYTDVSSFLAPGGFSVKRNDLEDKEAGRSTVTGRMYRKRIDSKQELTCTCKALEQSQTQILFPLIKPETVFINYIDPELGWRTGVEVYSNNVPATSLVAKEEGGATRYYWNDIKFPLIEV